MIFFSLQNVIVLGYYDIWEITNLCFGTWTKLIVRDIFSTVAQRLPGKSTKSLPLSFSRLFTRHPQLSIHDSLNRVRNDALEVQVDNRSSPAQPPPAPCFLDVSICLQHPCSYGSSITSTVFWEHQYALSLAYYYVSYLLSSSHTCRSLHSWLL